MKPAVFVALFVSALAISEASAESELYESGVEARIAGRLPEAYEALSKAAEEEPGNSDVLVQLGLTLVALQRYDEATATLERVLVIAPDYLDADIALARIAYFRGENAAARERIGRILERAPANQDALTLRDQLDTAIAAQARATTLEPPPSGSESRSDDQDDKRHRVDFDIAFSDLADGGPDWWEANVRYSYRLDTGATVSVLSQDAYRHEKFDSYAELRLDFAPTGAVHGYVFAGLTPDADFLPEWALGAGAGVRVAEGRGYLSTTVATVEGKISDYPTDRLYILNPGIEQYFGDGSMWATLQLLTAVNDAGDGGIGFSARFDRFFTDRLRGFARYVSAPESSDGIIQQTTSVSGGLVIDVTEAMTFRGTVAYESDPDRTTISIGTARRF